MRDYNFFSSILTKNSTGRKKNVLVNAAAAGLGVVAIAMLGLYGVQILLKMQTDAANNYLSANAERVNSLAILQNKISLIQKYSAYLKSISGDIVKVDLISSGMLDKVTNALPAATTIQSATIDIETMVLTVSTDSKAKASELVRNLKDTGLFSDVNLSDITTEPDTNQFRITVACALLTGGSK